jgi:hypothetical protein
MIHVSTYKKEEVGYHQPEGGIKFVEEKVQTGGWGVQIKSSKDLFTLDDEPIQTRNTLSDETLEKMR